MPASALAAGARETGGNEGKLGGIGLKMGGNGGGGIVRICHKYI